MPTLVTDDISTVPFSYQMAAGAVKVLSVNMALALDDGETFTTATTTLRNLETGEIDADLPTATVNGTSIVQVVSGPAIGFTKGETYELVLIANVSATSKPGRRLYIRVMA